MAQLYNNPHLLFFKAVIHLLQVLLDQLFKLFVLISKQNEIKSQGYAVFHVVQKYEAIGMNTAIRCFKVMAIPCPQSTVCDEQKCIWYKAPATKCH